MITPPMAFVFFGYLVSQEVLGLIRFSFDGELVHLVAELALILILFTDASWGALTHHKTGSNQGSRFIRRSRSWKRGSSRRG